MAKFGTKIVVVATPTNPLLSPILHKLAHRPDLEIVVLTRETSISLSQPISNGHTNSHEHSQTNGHHHQHEHLSPVFHIITDFSPESLVSSLQGTKTLIALLTGSDLHLTPDLISAASTAKVQLFIPSEYGLDTSNPKIREILPPYRNRYEVQDLLRKSGMAWKAIYAGVILEDGMKSDGVLGVDCAWASIVVFPGKDEERKIVVSNWQAVVNQIKDVALADDGGEGNEIWMDGWRVSSGELKTLLEKELDREVDRYEGDLAGARKEANERMKRGYFDGGVALMGRVAVWDEAVNAFAGWKDKSQGAGKPGIGSAIGKVVKVVRDGEIGGSGCGC